MHSTKKGRKTVVMRNDLYMACTWLNLISLNAFQTSGPEVVQRCTPRFEIGYRKQAGVTGESIR